MHPTNSKTVLNAVLALAFLILVSCQSASNAPTLSDLTNQTEATVNTASADASHRSLWGLFSVYADPDALTIESVPLRLTKFHRNIIDYLETAPCSDCLKFLDIYPSGSDVVNIDVELTHPFSDPRFTGFDVRGVVIFNGSSEFPVIGLNWSNNDLGNPQLVYPDGFTALYNPSTAGNGFEGYIQGKYATHTIPDGRLNAYKRFTPDSASNPRRMFTVENSTIVTYEILKPSGPFIFGYAIDGCWAPPVNEPVTDPENDFGPEANCPEAWSIEIEEFSIGAGLTETGGETRLQIDVYDWQGIDNTYPVMLECPELFDGQIEAEYVSPYTGYTRYEVIVENENLALVGEYQCLISKKPAEYDPAKPWLDMTAHQMCSLDVGIDVDIESHTNGLTSFSLESMISRGNYIIGLGPSGEYYPDGVTQLTVFDVTDPLDPTPVFGTSCGAAYPPDKIVATDSIAYISDGNSVYEAYDISNLPQISLIGSMEWNWEPPPQNDADPTIQAVKDNILFTHYDTLYSPEIVSWDISNPLYPEKLGDVTAGLEASTLVGDYLFVYAGSGLRVIDVSDPENMFTATEVELCDQSVHASGYQIRIDNGYAYLKTTDNTLDIVDIDPAESSHVAGSYPELDIQSKIMVVNGYVYATGWGWGEVSMEVFDATTPSDLLKLDTVDISKWARSFVRYGDYLNIFDDLNGLQVLDVTSPDTPSMESFLPSACSGSELAVSGEHAFIYRHHGRLQVVGYLPLGSPPEVIQTVDLPFIDQQNNVVFEMKYHDGYLYICVGDPDENRRLLILDVDPVTDIQIVSNILTDESTPRDID